MVPALPLRRRGANVHRTGGSATALAPQAASAPHRTGPKRSEGASSTGASRGKSPDEVSWTGHLDVEAADVGLVGIEQERIGRRRPKGRRSKRERGAAHRCPRDPSSRKGQRDVEAPDRAAAPANGHVLSGRARQGQESLLARGDEGNR